MAEAVGALLGRRVVFIQSRVRGILARLRLRLLAAQTEDDESRTLSGETPAPCGLFDHLPDELVARCLAILPFVDVVTTSRVCGAWYELRDSRPFRAVRELVDERALVFAGYIDEDALGRNDCFVLYRGRWRRCPGKPGVNDGPAMVIRNELVNLKTAESPGDGDAFSLETNQWRPVDVGQVGDVSSQTFADPFIVALLRKDELTADGAEIYCLESHRLGDDGNWVDIPPPPLGLGADPSLVTICGLHGVVYVLGTTEMRRRKEIPTNNMQAFDLTSRAWRVCPPMPEKCVDPLMLEVNGRLFVLCGRVDVDDEIRSNAVYAFDPTSETWTRERSVPTNQLQTVPWGLGASAAAHDGRLVLFGLEHSPPLELVDGAWSPLPQLPCLGPGYSSLSPQLGSLLLWC